MTPPPHTVTHLACVLQSNTQYYLGGDHTSVIFGENNCLVSDRVDLNDLYYKPYTSPVPVRPLFTHTFTLQCSHNVLYYFGITSQIPESNTRLEHVHTSTARYTARSCTCPRRTMAPLDRHTSQGATRIAFHATLTCIETTFASCPIHALAKVS